MTSRHMRRFCDLDPPSHRLLIAAIDRLNLSARAHDRILKVARTIADLAGCERIESAHVAEACSIGRWIGRISGEGERRRPAG